MKGLLKKDLLHLKVQFLPVYAYSVFMLIMIVAATLSTGVLKVNFLSNLSIIPSAIAVLMFMDDIRTGSIKTMLCMPVSIKDHVSEKYLFSLINALGSGAVFLVVMLVCVLIRGIDTADVLSGTMLITGTVLIYPMLVLPFVYGLGLRSARKVVMFSLLGLFFMWITSIVTMKVIIDLTLTKAAVMFAVILALFALSFAVSLKVCENKDIE